jgi:DNA-binding protein YbaB
MEMQKKLRGITYTHKKGKWTVKVTGDQKIDYIEVGGEPQTELVKAINEALDAVQKESAKKMVEEGGLSALFKGI